LCNTLTVERRKNMSEQDKKIEMDRMAPKSSGNLPPGIGPKLAKKYMKLLNSSVTQTSQDAEADTQQLFSGGIAYVPNFGSNTVSVVDIRSARLITNIPVGNAPFAVDISPDGRFAYVSNFVSATLSIIRTLDNRVVNTVNLNTGIFTAAGSSGVKVTRNGRFVYVANFNSNNISVVDAQQRSVVTVVPLTSSPSNIGIWGSLAYVTLPSTNQIAVVDLNANLQVKTINGGDTEGIDIATLLPLALVTNQSNNTLSFINTNIAEASTLAIATGEFPTGVSFTPNGRMAYVANQFSNDVSVIDLIRHTQVTIPVGVEPFGVKVNRSGRFAVVSNTGSDNLSIIDTRVNQVIATVDVGIFPQYLAILDL
jgi:YVTN family beta-propeller protein